jgi:hypothetical protein
VFRLRLCLLGCIACLFAVAPAAAVADPYRSFDGVNDELTMRLSAGSNITGAVTMAAVVKIADKKTDLAVFGLSSPGEGANGYGLIFQGLNLALDNGISAAQSSIPGKTIVENSWQLWAVSKANGSATPRFHLYDFGAKTWVHDDGNKSIANASSQEGERLRIGKLPGYGYWPHSVAAVAIFDHALSDLEVESLPSSYGSWLAREPGGMWILNQAHVSHPLLDETGGGADELFESTVGTSVVSSGSPLTGDPDDTIFHGDFSTGDASQWKEVQETGTTADFEVSSASPPLGENFFGRFEMDEGDTRAEVAGAPHLLPGEDLYFRFKARLGENFPAEESGSIWGQLIWQLHHQGTSGSPPIALEIAGNGMGFFGLRGPSGTFWWEGPSVDTNWHEFVIRVNHATSKEVGFAELWMDGVQQTMTNGKARYYASTLLDAYNYPKIGYYRDNDMVKPGMVDIAGYEISRSF